ncbi:hypothetical protein [Paenarthrobacter sp. C1]|uniref:hypothetical protein n=1 Tax=Paenarthrobacter sp. C1 TaxID=3400220 RepID=UPI003BF50237
MTTLVTAPRRARRRAFPLLALMLAAPIAFSSLTGAAAAEPIPDQDARPYQLEGWGQVFTARTNDWGVVGGSHSMTAGAQVLGDQPPVEMDEADETDGTPDRELDVLAAVSTMLGSQWNNSTNATYAAAAQTGRVSAQEEPSAGSASVRVLQRTNDGAPDVTTLAGSIFANWWGDGEIPDDELRFTSDDYASDQDALIAKSPDACVPAGRIAHTSTVLKNVKTKRVYFPGVEEGVTLGRLVGSSELTIEGTNFVNTAGTRGLEVRASSSPSTWSLFNDRFTLEVTEASASARVDGTEPYEPSVDELAAAKGASLADGTADVDPTATLTNAAGEEVHVEVGDSAYLVDSDNPDLRAEVRIGWSYKFGPTIYNRDYVDLLGATVDLERFDGDDWQYLGTLETAAAGASVTVPVGGIDCPPADYDDDGLLDNDETETHHTSPHKADTDGDGYSDAAEIADGTDPLDPLSPKPAPEPDPDPEPVLDTDGDGLPDAEEKRIGTSAVNPDTDADKLSDGDEVLVYKTLPLVADTDGDGIPDGDEVYIYGTSPVDSASNLTTADRDRDGLSDARERELGTDPTRADTDGDGLGDGVEVTGSANTYGHKATNPLNPDTDGDKLPDGREVRHVGAKRLAGIKTDPNRVDTDRDGLTDGAEVLTRTKTVVRGVKVSLRSNPVKKDSDGDGLSDKVERTGKANKLYGHKPTSPWRSDTDGDGIKDGAEVKAGTDPTRPGAAGTRPRAHGYYAGPLD